MKGSVADDGAPVSVPGLVVRFTLAGVVVMAALATVIGLLARQAGTQQAVDSAEQITWVTARGIAEPRLNPAVLAGDQDALNTFHAAMTQYVLRGSLARVKIWDESGRIVYSDERRLIGETFDLEESALVALRRQQATSATSDMTRPENKYERSYAKMLEVYVGVRATDGTPLVFEGYFAYDAVVDAGQAQWRSYAPPALGALLALELVQIPFAWSLARRLQRQQRERSRLLQHAVQASDAERRRIAGDLHDGVVQELSGLTFALDAARLGTANPERDAELIRSTAAQLRETTSTLRSLLIEIYPPDLARDGLAPVLTDLVGTVEQSGVTVHLDVDEAVGLAPPLSAVIFRAAQEILRNVVAHSRARTLHVAVRVNRTTARLVVEDDGAGFAPDELEERQGQGHFGLRTLGDLVSEADGRFTVRSAPDEGTWAEVVLPLHSGASR